VLAIDDVYGSVAVYPLAGGATRRIAVPALDGWRYPRWAAGDAIVVTGFARGRPPRLWRVDAGGATPITDEGVGGAFAVSPDGRTAALITGERLVAVDVAGGGVRELARGFTDDAVCGWWTGGGEVLVRGLTAPIAVRRISVATGTIAPVVTIDPPRLGRRGVFTVTVSADGGAYAYSYNAHASRLYSLTSDEA
jgi:eukaryotic-like serine/threonine-protein kinase